MTPSEIVDLALDIAVNSGIAVYMAAGVVVALGVMLVRHILNWDGEQGIEWMTQEHYPGQYNDYDDSDEYYDPDLLYYELVDEMEQDDIDAMFQEWLESQ